MRHVTVYEVSKPAPREPRHIILSSEGREIRGVTGIWMAKEAIYAKKSGPIECELNFELGKRETVIATFIQENACAT